MADEFGWTQLAQACYAGDLEAVRRLVLEEAADIEQANRAGVTPLMQACRSRKPSTAAIVLFLLEHNANALRETNDGWTALSYLVAECRSVEPVALVELLYRGADPLVQTRDGRDAYDWAQAKQRAMSPHIFALFDALASHDRSLQWRTWLVLIRSVPQQIALVPTDLRDRLYIDVCAMAEEAFGVKIRIDLHTLLAVLIVV